MMYNFVEKDKDLAVNRSIDIDGNKIWIKKEDPYGFWRVSFEKGRIPKSLEGMFTSPDMALKLVNVYLREKDRAPVKQV